MCFCVTDTLFTCAVLLIQCLFDSRSAPLRNFILTRAVAAREWEFPGLFPQYVIYIERVRLLYGKRSLQESGLPLSGRTTFITPCDCHRMSKLNFKDVPWTSEISFVRPKLIPRDVQKWSKGPPTFNQLYDVCPAYLPEIRYLCWLSFKDVPLSACGSFIDSRVMRRGTLLMTAWSLCVFVTVLSWLIDVFILLWPRKYSLKLYEVIIIF